MTQRELSDAALAYDAPDRLTCPSAPYSLPRRLFRSTIHYLSYHFILKRPWTTTARAAGFRLLVPPTVFHPRFFLTSEYFASFIDKLDLKGKSVADVGTGTGILALAAARAGASHVVAIDINPHAASAAERNARANDLGERVTGVCSNLLSALASRPTFDVILSSPPSFAGEPCDLADRAWHAGPGYRDIALLFDQARERLTTGGQVYVLFSSDTEPRTDGLADRAGGLCCSSRRRAFAAGGVLHSLRNARPERQRDRTARPSEARAAAGG